MKFTRTIYPDYPDVQGSPCWKLQGRWIDIDADWNPRFPFGMCTSLHIGRQPPPVQHLAACETNCRCAFPNPTPGFCLDLNPPLGEANRLYLWLGNWHVTLGLPSVRDFRETSRERTLGRNGKMVTTIHGEHFSNWRRPHIDGCDRYRYHQDESGRWVRNDKPEPLHWGWLTIERRRT
jgi:hypothetical protein